MPARCLAAMNLTIRGIDFNLGRASGYAALTRPTGRGMSSDAKTAANAGRVSPQGVTRRDGDGVSPQGVGLRCANPTYGKSRVIS